MTVSEMPASVDERLPWECPGRQGWTESGAADFGGLMK